MDRSVADLREEYMRGGLCETDVAPNSTSLERRSQSKGMHFRLR